MKVDYEVRALKFAKVLVTLFANCATYYDFVAAVELYNKTHTRKLCYASGVSRFAVMRADYVIKFDMAPEAGWEDGRAGNNDTELQVYETAVADGMEYLLAKTTIAHVGNRDVAIMPRISHVDDYDRYWREYCTAEEARWLDLHLRDLHDGNVGYRNGKVCVIDYAWDATREIEDDSWDYCVTEEDTNSDTDTDTGYSLGWWD